MATENQLDLAAQLDHSHDDHRALQPLTAQLPINNAPVDSLTCQWVACGERCTSPEALYDHVCERHVGRKSTNNLNLTCQWGACRTTTVKRDHITSHMRVHVPLKPHKCDFCGKSFKRPQDLKKHVKTHADDSVLMRSPENAMNQQQGNGNGFHQQDNKIDSAYFAGAAHDLGAGPYPSHHNAPVAPAGTNFYPNPPQYSGYGQVNYPQNSLADQQSMDTRKRAIEALNDFLGDVKRRALDPGSYYDVGQRLNTQSLPLPVSIGSGYSMGNSYNGNSYGSNNNMMDAFGGSNGSISMNGGGGVGVQGPLAQSYALPNARTKTDLLDIDRFLEQLQATVYETSNSAAAAGVQQPGVHTQYGSQYPGFNNFSRSSNSPPSMQQNGHSSMSSGSVQPLSSVAQMASMTASAGGLDTPALTPASISSYASSGHSPMSSHSRSSLDDTNGNSMYPSLPSVTAMSDMGTGYNSAPASNLASGFEGFEGRRYSGGRLQREAPGSNRDGNVDMDAMDTDEQGNTTPRKAAAKEARPSSSSLDPALRGSPSVQSPETSTPTQSETADDKNQESWVENIRVIETLRKWIGERLATKDYDRSNDAEATPEPMDQRSRSMEREEQEQEQVAYPALKTEV